MTEMHDAQQETQPLAELSREELASATDIMQGFARLLKACTLYVPGGPVLNKLITDQSVKMREYLGLYGELRLDIDRLEVRFKGRTLYSSQELRDNIAFKFYAEGVRCLLFSDGIEFREIADFVEILGTTGANEDDDIVTLLWARELHHIGYVLEDDAPDEGMDAAFTPASAGKERGFAAMARDITSFRENAIRPASSRDGAPPVMIPALSHVPREISHLGEAEKARLNACREADEQRNPLQDVLTILSVILLSEEEEETFDDFVKITIRLAGDIIRTGEISYAIGLSNFLRKQASNSHLPPLHRERIDKALEKMLADELLNDLITIIDTSERFTPETLRALLLIFGRPSFASICELLAGVEKRKMRKVIIDVLAEIGKDSPEMFFPFLKDERWYLVRNMIFALRIIGIHSALEPVIGLVPHADQRVRKEVLTYLGSRTEPRARSAILRFLHDDSRQIRLHALQIVRDQKLKGALITLTQSADTKGFDDLELVEKVAIFEALGAVGGNELLPRLREYLMRKYLFNMAKGRELITCAVAALKTMNSEEAVQLLKEARAVRTSEFQGIIDRALQDMKQ